MPTEKRRKPTTAAQGPRTPTRTTTKKPGVLPTAAKFKGLAPTRRGAVRRGAPWMPTVTGGTPDAALARRAAQLRRLQRARPRATAPGLVVEPVRNVYGTARPMAKGGKVKVAAKRRK